MHGTRRKLINFIKQNKEVKVGDQTARLQIWDTAGQERFRAITNVFYRHAQGKFQSYQGQF